MSKNDDETRVTISRKEGVWESYTIPQFIDKYHVVLDKVEHSEELAEKYKTEWGLEHTKVTRLEAEVESLRQAHDATKALSQYIQDCDFGTIGECVFDAIMRDHKRLQAEVESLKQCAVTRATQSSTEDSVEIWGRKYHATPDKPVVWVRKVGYGGGVSRYYHRCSENGFDISALNLSMYDWEGLYRDIADVRIWEEPVKDEAIGQCQQCGEMVKLENHTCPPIPKPAQHEWVYGVWKKSGEYWAMNGKEGIHCEGQEVSWHDTSEDALRCLARNLNSKTYSSQEGRQKTTPIFGVRRLTEGEKRKYGVSHTGVDYTPFYNGKPIMYPKGSCSFSASYPIHCLNPEAAIQIVLDALTPATPAVTLDSLEVVS